MNHETLNSARLLDARANAENSLGVIASMMLQREVTGNLGVELRTICDEKSGVPLRRLTLDAQVTNRMLSEHGHYYGLGMDALLTVFSRNTNVIMVWAWMLW